MNKYAFRTILMITIFVALAQCKNKQSKDNASSSHSDTIAQNKRSPVHINPQVFTIDSKQDNVVEGENGTIIICPKGCFKNAKGNIVEENVKIELSEALSLTDMVLSNLSTTSNGKLLETDGMIYFNAYTNGEKLVINKDNPIHLEIPTSEKKPGMMAYKGVIDVDGGINWVDPKPIDHYLKTVDMQTLDFLPEGFQAEVEKGMPYKNYQVATRELVDSLFYSLAVSDRADLSEGLVETTYNEPYYNKGSNAANGKYTANSYQVKHKSQPSDSSKDDYQCGVNPAIIKVIKSTKYQNTLIATKEFETRLHFIFKSFKQPLLELYVKNLNRNLFEIDSMAAQICKSSDGAHYYQEFKELSGLKLTKVKNADKYALLLRNYYEKQLSKVMHDLNKQRDRYVKILDKKNREAQEVAKEYTKLLWKREKYRMETYGFNWTDTGWVNIDRGTIPKDWGLQPLEIAVSNGKQFDRVYSYVVYTSIKSLYRLNTTDHEQFYAGNEDRKEMLMPKRKLGIAIAIGYNDEVPAMALKEFMTGAEPKINLTLLPSSIEKVEEAIKPYEQYKKENRMSIDLEFMKEFHKENQRQKKLQKEEEFLSTLRAFVFHCNKIPGFSDTRLNQ